ncbi:MULTISPECIES: nucleotidyltransferase family protein [Halocynthiibacter]|uniref:Nucleotidyltransferase family protein n=1 Tax=Halocynthiibacter halioticoli TaxID=2986804 RepID=A0AAE3J396_9RHOB|nr:MULTISPECIES: nucleotidyltransferase family protein [Halocynthiibacter]MCV6825631.1 nucleotidyltransferase family protein [Halocynthiibacter halioticoli]MCW4058632.1 nucleotidyltransferase family protein [Halocynthiibacter sp. SDUM655004]
MPDALMLFTAGKGTRMGSLTRDLPKPLIKVAGRPLVDHALDLVSPMPELRVVANLHTHADKLEAHLSQSSLVLSDERDALLETGGGLRKAIPLLNSSPVFTLNSDAVWKGPNPLECLKSAWDPNKMDALLLLIPSENAIGHMGSGDFALENDSRISRGGPYVYTGAQIIKTERLDEIEEDAFSLNALWDILIQSDRVFGTVYSGSWCDVGRPENIALAENMLRGNADVS